MGTDTPTVVDAAKVEAQRAKFAELSAQDFDSLTLDEKLWLLNSKLNGIANTFAQLGQLAQMMGGKPKDVASQLLDGVL